MKNPEKVYQQIIKGIRNYFKKAQKNRAVLGVSGGIDSALTLKLAVDALEPENVTVIQMPEKGVTNEENTYHARTLCNFFRVKSHTVPINQFLMNFNILPWGTSELANMNLKARVRMALLYHFANTESALVLGTSNKSEILLGYGTKYGDFAGDIEVIGSLYKEDVYALAEYLELPNEFMEKKPSAELHPGQTDEDELGASYKELDQILKQHTLGLSGLIEKGMRPELVHRVIRRIEENKHKTSPAPIIKIKETDIR